MKIFKIIILFIVVLSGCSSKYVEPGEEEVIGREWRVLDTEILGQYNVGLVLNLNVKEFVEVKDSVKLRKLYESSRRRVGQFKILGGCMVAGSAALISFFSAYGEAINPGGGGSRLAIWSGAVGGVGALYFIINGFSDLRKVSKRTEPYYIKNNIICKNSTTLRNDEVKIMLKNTTSEKTYYTDKNGIIQLKFDEIIPEPSKADSVLNLIIQYEEMADTLEIKRL